MGKDADFLKSKHLPWMENPPSFNYGHQAWSSLAARCGAQGQGAFQGTLAGVKFGCTQVLQAHTSTKAKIYRFRGFSAFKYEIKTNKDHNMGIEHQWQQIFLISCLPQALFSCNVRRDLKTERVSYCYTCFPHPHQGKRNRCKVYLLSSLVLLFLLLI